MLAIPTSLCSPVHLSETPGLCPCCTSTRGAFLPSSKFYSSSPPEIPISTASVREPPLIFHPGQGSQTPGFLEPGTEQLSGNRC